MKTFIAQAAAGAPPASPIGAGGRDDFTPARRRPLRGNTMKIVTFGSVLAIAAACAATSAYAKPKGPSPHAPVKTVVVIGNDKTETVVEKNKVNNVVVSIVGKDDTVTVEEIGKINSIISSIIGTGDTVIGIQIGIQNSFSSVVLGSSNTSAAVQFGWGGNVSHIHQWGNDETAVVVQVGRRNFSLIVQGRTGKVADPPAASDQARAEGIPCRYTRSTLCY